MRGSSTHAPEFFGRSSVTWLNYRTGPSMANFYGFTSLSDLYLSAYDLPTLDLTGCVALREAYITDLGSCSSVQLRGCVRFKRLVWNRFKGLTQIDLSACRALEQFYMPGSGLTSLNVSCCPRLTSIDVSDSKRLKRLVVGSSDTDIHIICSGCPDLESIWTVPTGAFP